MDAAGNMAFHSYLQAGGGGIYYQGVAGPLMAVALNGGTTPGLADTFAGFERPSLTTGGIAFRAFLDVTGQSVWKGDPSQPQNLSLVAMSNATSYPGLPAGSKLWSVWSPYSNASGKIAFRVSLLDSSGAETRAIVTDVDGTARIIAKVGDPAPGTAGTFTNFDHPVIGDGNQAAFIASTSDGVVGLWRQAVGGGALSLILQVGQTVQDQAGPAIIGAMLIPGTASSDRLNEVRCMDAAGHVLVHVTYDSGATGVVVAGQ